MWNKSLLIFFVCIFVFGMFSNVSYGQNNIKVFIDGREVFLSSTPVMINSTMLVPIRGVMENIGASVFWDENSKTIMISKDEATLLFQLNNRVAVVNGEAVLLNADSQVIDGTTMVPLRIVVETFDMYVNYTNNKLYINTGLEYKDSVNHGKMMKAFKEEDYDSALNYARKISDGSYRNIFYYYVNILSAYELGRHDLIELIVNDIPEDLTFLSTFAKGVAEKDFSGVMNTPVKMELDYYIKAIVCERNKSLENQEVFLNAALGVNNYINKGMLLRKRAGVYESLGLIEKALLDYNNSLSYSLVDKNKTVNKVTVLMNILKTEKNNIPMASKIVLKDKSEYSGQVVKGLPHGLGVQIFEDGRIYIGDFINGVRSGNGLLMRPTGHLYTGAWSNGNPHGIGTLLWPDGMYYAGNWNKGVMQGNGCMNYTDGTVYDGAWKDNSKNGYGVETKLDGTKYIGEFKDNKRTGKGTLEVPQVGIYIGDFIDGRRHGLGKFVASDHTYSGTWVNDKREDNGRVDFKNKDFYVGEFKGNVFHGNGVYTWANGDVYKGGFVAGEKSGVGELKYKDSSYYVGDFKYDLFEGRGILYIVNNYKYKGSFFEGEKSGNGELICESGEVYIGEFKEDVYNGTGILTLANGTRYEGSFSNGVYHGNGVLNLVGQKSLRGRFSEGVFVGSDAGNSEGEKGGVEFVVVQNNYKTMTDAEWKVYSGNLLGKRIKWSGAINNVKEDGEVLVVMDSEDELNYVVSFYIIWSDILNYKKDQKINFEGNIKSIDTLIGFKIELINVLVDANIVESGDDVDEF